MNKSLLLLVIILTTLVLPYAINAETEWTRLTIMEGSGPMNGHSHVFSPPDNATTWRVFWNCSLTKLDHFFIIGVYSHNPAMKLHEYTVRTGEPISEGIWNMTEHGNGDFYITYEGRTNWFQVYLEYPETEEIPEFPTGSLAFLFIGLCGSAIVIRKRLS